MKAVISIVSAAAVALIGIGLSQAESDKVKSDQKASDNPQEDIKQFQSYYKEKFPKVEFEDFVNGAYAIDPVARENWEAIEEFPPYEPALDEGEELWETPFANGKSYKDCFPEGSGIKAKYPHWDKTRSQVVTLELAINECREKNGEKPLNYEKGPLAALTAYIAHESRGDNINVEIPKDDPKALEAYRKGKEFYYQRRGKLNLACAHCHVAYPGYKLRSETLSPALGHAASWPVYRAKWGELGTLHRRFKGCNEQTQAKPFEPQSEEYRNLEYFLTAMSNGLPFSGPASRK